MNIFVGNLAFEATEIDVQRAFMAFGVVTSVAIVMEKKGKKSRGFGFVEMPDEQEALAAIAQLQGKEILGRPVNVLPAISKEPKVKAAGKKNERSNVIAQDNQQGFRQEPTFKRTGKYKQGRRTLSYLKKRRESGITAPPPARSYKSNPLRWRKKPRRETPYAKPAGEFKPWQRPQTESNPWKKPKTKSNSWKKPESELKPWQKPQSEAGPWEKKAKPWKREENAAKPWKRTASSSQPWEKSKSPGGHPRLKRRGRFSQR